MSRRIVLMALSLSMLCAPSAHAASIFLPDGVNNLTALVFIAGGGPPTVFDLAGSASGTIFDLDTATNMGGALAVTIPIDPDFGNGIDLNTASPGSVSMTFDFGSAVFEDGFLTLTGTGLAALFDLALTDFEGPVVAFFTFQSTTQLGEGTLDTYQLAGIRGEGEQVTAVPEPASLTLLGIGLAGAAARRRKMRQ